MVKQPIIAATLAMATLSQIIKLNVAFKEILIITITKLIVAKAV